MVSKKQQPLTNFLFQLSILELHGRTMNTPEEGRLEEEVYANNNITIIDSTSRNILPPQLKNMTHLYKGMCGCGCFRSEKRIHS